MSFMPSLRISASGLTAQRLRMDVISSNIANVNTTRSSEGGPYRRREVVFAPSATPSRLTALGRQAGEPAGVRAVAIVDQNAVRLVNDPTHPDADANGYVAYPDIDIVQEITDMMSAVRAYEASVTAINAAKGMAQKALEIGRG